MKINLAFVASILARAQNSNKQLDGIGVYTQELLKEFLSNSDELRVKKIAYRDDIQNQPANDHAYHLTRLSFKTSSAISYSTRLGTPGLDRHLEQCDLIHSPDHCIPQTRKIPLIVSIMDVIPLTHPQYLTSSLRAFKANAFKYLAKQADHIITISEFSAQEIVKSCGIDRSKISVTYLGVDTAYFDRQTLESIQVTQQKYGLLKPYFLFVGTLQPRKNLYRLVQAYLKLPSTVRQSIQLVIVGRAGLGMQELVNTLENDTTKDEIKWLKYIPDGDLKPLLQGATALVYPSLYEGFGLPIIEAFASAVPVITSQTTSMPEVAGDAALLVDPESVDSISQAMLKTIEQPIATQARVAAGVQRAKNFTWHSTASQTIRVYKDVLSKR
jgi:glycosyltransferase involved in cell wall biosynthesis